MRRIGLMRIAFLLVGLPLSRAVADVSASMPEAVAGLPVLGRIEWEARHLPFVAPGPRGAAPSPQLEAFREGLQITETILHLRGALADPQHAASIDPAVAAEANAVIQILMDVMESNRRFRPAGTADVWPHVRRVYELAAEVAEDTAG